MGRDGQNEGIQVGSVREPNMSGQAGWGSTDEGVPVLEA